MKSFVTYPQKLEKKLFKKISGKLFSARLAVYFRLYERLMTVEGSVVKCGITTPDDVLGLTVLLHSVSFCPPREVIAFQKFTAKTLYDNIVAEKKPPCNKNKQAEINSENLREVLEKKEIKDAISFVPGNVEEAIPGYLLENPDLKIACLIIDMDDFEATFTILEFFYPRLVHQGILVLDNYYKKEEDYKAADQFFKKLNIKLNRFPGTAAPHYFIRS